MSIEVRGLCTLLQVFDMPTHGIDAEAPKAAPWGAKQLYLRDPDGYSLCFQWPEKGEQS